MSAVTKMFQPDIPEGPKVDEGAVRARERKRRLRFAGHASTNIASKSTLGGTSNNG